MRSTLLTTAAFALIAVGAEAQPVPPCSPSGTAVVPTYGEVAAPPSIQTWHDIELTGREACLGGGRGRMELVIALASKFDGARPLSDIAARIGAISAMKGLLYWSSTEQSWRILISESYAIDGPTTRRPRPDFAADEVLSGRTLYYAQNDMRSTGLNVDSLTAKAAGPGRLVFETVNLTPIKFAFVTLFEPRELRAVHFIDRLKDGAWGYYGISAVRSVTLGGYENSFVNRGAAFYS